MTFVLLATAVYFVIAVYLAFYLWIAKRSANQQRARLRSELSDSIDSNTKLREEQTRLQSEVARLETENQALAQFRTILDAQAEAVRIVAEATRKANEAERAADLLRKQTESAAEDRDAQAKVESTMRSAHQEADSIVANAIKRGEEIAGAAFEAVKNAENFERVARAMKNLIEGYGDQYVIPSRSLLDLIADITASPRQEKSSRTPVSAHA
jgi:cell division protein FtsB